MPNTMTKWELFKALAGEHALPRHFTTPDGCKVFGALQAIEREDGSGKSFNCRIANQSGKITINVRTVD